MAHRGSPPFVVPIIFDYAGVIEDNGGRELFFPKNRCCFSVIGGLWNSPGRGLRYADVIIG